MSGRAVCENDFPSPPPAAQQEAASPSRKDPARMQQVESWVDEVNSEIGIAMRLNEDGTSSIGISNVSEAPTEDDASALVAGGDAFDEAFESVSDVASPNRGRRSSLRDATPRRRLESRRPWDVSRRRRPRLPLLQTPPTQAPWNSQVNYVYLSRTDYTRNFPFNLLDPYGPRFAPVQYFGTTYMCPLPANQVISTSSGQGILQWPQYYEQYPYPNFDLGASNQSSGFCVGIARPPSITSTAAGTARNLESSPGGSRNLESSPGGSRNMESSPAGSRNLESSPAGSRNLESSSRAYSQNRRAGNQRTSRALNPNAPVFVPSAKTNPTSTNQGATGSASTRAARPQSLPLLSRNTTWTNKSNGKAASV